MQDVFIIGGGQIPVTKSGDVLGRLLAADAVKRALADADLDTPDALYVGNMMSGILSQQQQMGALVAHAAGLRGIEAATAEAACASGAAAMRWGVMAVGSGQARTAVVCGIEKMTHTTREETTTALATASDWQYEGSCGASFISLNATLMAAYIAEYGVTPEDFSGFALNAHANANKNPNALFHHKQVTLDVINASRVLVPPVRLFDASPVCNGAAALVLADADVAAERARAGHPVVRVVGSAVATDSLGLRDRASLLELAAVRGSSQRAFAQAGLTPADVDLFEVHDAYTVISTLSLEGSGFATPGTGTRFAVEGRITPDGDLPLCTMGGLKARGHPVGATGIYQLLEATLQLTGRAGDAQLPRTPTVAMTQNIGGTGATVVTHLLTRHA